MSAKLKHPESEILKPYEPFELNADGGSSTSNPTKTLRKSTDKTDKPAAPETLGQNQVSDIIADVLRDSLVWDAISGQWFRRSNVELPFREQSSITVWQTINSEVSRLMPKYSASFVNGVETFMKAELAATQWDNTRHEIPVSNGVLDLNTRMLRKYRAEDRFNWQLPYPFDIDATCPLIDKTILRMVGGNSELVEFLYAWLLVVLLGLSNVQAFLELVGSGGTGKSTFLNLLSAVVGDENTVTTDLNALETNKFETAVLYGKRLTIVSDSARFRGEVPVLKSITGGDRIRLERKNQQQQKPFVYRGLVTIAANQPLESSDYTSGLQRRRRSLTINYVVSDEEKKPYQDTTTYPDGFEGALKAELPGLLNKLLAMDANAAAELVANPDKAMKAQRLVIELETNPLLAWADECLVSCSSQETRIGDANKQPNEGLYSNYCAYVTGGGRHPISITAFSRNLVDILHAYDIQTVKTRSAFTFMKGLRLRGSNDENTPHLITKILPTTGEFTTTSKTEGLL
ncbi:DNA primase family protein [Granulosicoccus sp. 3-233]|uniref:DNA primase family protein n=1 Tax=Granulosicoccus sp. 3-233 TaxID=3417969 RepID=UPI003D3496E7